MADDMQFAFSYFYFLMSEKEEMELEKVFTDFDTDHTGYVWLCYHCHNTLIYIPLLRPYIIPSLTPMYTFIPYVGVWPSLFFTLM